MSLGLSKAFLVGSVGIAGTAGTIYVGSKFINSSTAEEKKGEVVYTIKEKFKGRLITKSDFGTGWNSRLEQLKKDDSDDLHKGLKELKIKNPLSTGRDLNVWCNDSYVKAYEDGSSLAKGVEKYCTYLLREQIEGLIIDKQAGSWTDAKEKLKGTDDNQLSTEMQKIKKDDSLDAWCLGKYETPFQDERDGVYLDVFKFCKAVIKRVEGTAVESRQSEGSG